MTEVRNMGATFTNLSRHVHARPRWSLAGFGHDRLGGGTPPAKASKTFPISAIETLFFRFAGAAKWERGCSFLKEPVHA
jgi:hypothetical protein